MKTMTLDDLVAEREKLINSLKYWNEKHEFAEIGNDSYYLSYDYKQNSQMISSLSSTIAAFDKVINHLNVTLYSN